MDEIDAIKWKCRISGLLDEMEQLLGCAENDVEGATVAVWGLRNTHPDCEDDQYFAEEIRIMNEYCPLLKVDYERHDLPEEFQRRAEEMIGMIHEGVERLEAGFSL